MQTNRSLALGLVPSRLLFLLLFLFPAFISHGQNQTAKVTPKSSIYYYEYLPPDYATTTENYPVVFFMHGIGERGNNSGDLQKVAKNGPPKHVKNGFQFPFILISPQCKTNLSWPAWYIDEVVEHVRSTLRIDPRRIYITGLSLGGGGAWTYTQTYPEKVAALAAICGGFNSIAAACKLSAANIPVWAFHGDKDGTVHWTRSQKMVDAINACIPPPSPLALFTIYPGIGHNAWDKAFATDNSLHTPNAYQWLMQWTNGGVSVSAGIDINLNLPTASTNIKGTASTETGTIISYNWTQVSGPVVLLLNASTPILSLTDLIEGIYTFKLTATNNNGESGSDEVKVTLLKINLAPVASAGNDHTLTLPSNAINISGTGSDTDGSIVSYTWVKVSGPATTLTGTTAATLKVTNLVQGTYVFRLTVKDNLGATHIDDVSITVNPEGANQLPVAKAGNDLTINLPTSTANLPGTGSDADGTIVSYLWEKVSGPIAVLNTPSAALLSLSQLISGSYVFKLTVTDNKGAKGSDQVNVTVAGSNQLPIAVAGTDITLTKPTKKTSIKGSGIDPDGNIASYSWSQISGPGAATLTNTASNTVTANNLIVGTYVFRLVVTDNSGATGSDDVSVMLNELILNIAPVVNAGSDQNVALPLNFIAIEGSVSDTDGTITSLKWEKVSGPEATLVNTATTTLTVQNLLAGTYTFRLTATDNDGAVSTDEVAISVMPDEVNQAPVANAGEDVGLTLPINNTVLNGLGTDADGSIVSYRWEKTSGPGGAVTSQTPTLVVNGLVAGVYIFTFTVTDSRGATSSDEVSITVQSSNIPPVANAGSDLTIDANNTIINGLATDPDGTVKNYLWQQGSGPNTAILTNDNTGSLTVSGLVAGAYTFRFTVTDNDGAKHSDDVKVIVNFLNQAPVLSVDDDKTITLPNNTVNFTSSAIDSDGEIVAYQWTQIDGSSATLENTNTPTLTVTVSTSDVYTFKIEVTDDDGAKNFEEVMLTVNAFTTNVAPVVTIPESEPVTLPLNTINLFGSASDEDGSITSYRWTKVSGPSVTLTNATFSTLSLSRLVEGTYKFRLMVTDDGGLTSYAETTITVLPAHVNQPPVAFAGDDQILILPDNGTIVNGSGSDADGTVLTYHWTKTQGPTTAIINADIPGLTLLNLTAGIYVFSLTVKDEDGAVDMDDVMVTVKPAGTNLKPIADAGPDLTITLPVNMVNLEGSGSDSDGSIIQYSWLKVSGPPAATDDSNLATITISDLTAGTYVYRLEVTDDDGETHTDDVTIHVLPASVNQPPQVNIDGTKNIFLPENSTLLIGTANDPDGTIVSYFWRKIEGPQAILINDATSALTLNDLVEGSYQFSLTVTDDKGASASSEFAFTVNLPTVNRAPVADAGEDFTINLPLNSATIPGSGIDAESTILIYSWIKIGGPAVTVTDQDKATLSLTGMEEGMYTFSLTVTDEGAETATDFVTVTVLPAHINTPPVVNAGDDITLTLPENSTSLTGAAEDDGLIQKIQWSKIAGPEIDVGDGASNPLVLNGLKEGRYTFRYTVTDNGGLANFDEVMITVFPEPAVILPPVVDAGPDVTVQLPKNSLTINADANSAAGLIVSYRWTQVLGNPVNIPVDTVQVLDLTGIPPGEYVFRITVTDNWDNETFDDVHVIVLEENPTVRPRNTFSPNGDDIDQTWKIENAFLLTGSKVVVFTRSGLKVYESTGYNNEWEGDFKGRPLDEGVYFYVIRCDYGKAITGSVMLIR